MKGEYLQECNRTSCQQPPATHYNFSTRKWYCESCAQLINENNKADSLRMFGHDLCMPVNVDRTFNDTIKIVLPCGYTQKFWVDISDEEAFFRCMQMKDNGIKSN